MVKNCECGASGCDRIILCMGRPVIKPTTETGELVSMVYLPVEHAQMVVDQIRALAKKKGVRVK